MSLLISKYMLVAERMRDAARRGLDVDHYTDELHGLVLLMSAEERATLREMLAERGEKRAAA